MAVKFTNVRADRNKEDGISIKGNVGDIEFNEVSAQDNEGTGIRIDVDLRADLGLTSEADGRELADFLTDVKAAEGDEKREEVAKAHPFMEKVIGWGKDTVAFVASVLKIVDSPTFQQGIDDLLRALPHLPAH